MGTILLTIEKLNDFFINPDVSNSWENSQIKEFIERAFLIGKDKTIEDVFEKDLGLVSLQFDHYEFFKLSKNKKAVQYFNNYIQEKEDLDDVLFDLAENNYYEFLWLYNDNYTPPIERPYLEVSSSKPELNENRDSFFTSVNKKQEERSTEVAKIIAEIDKKIEFANQILNQLKLKRNLGQDNLLNENVKDLIQAQIYRMMIDGVNEKDIKNWESLLSDASRQIEGASQFFEEDYNRTADYFQRTLEDLQKLRDDIINLDLRDFEGDTNFNSSINERYEDEFSMVMNNMSSSSYDLEEDEPETVEETLDRLTRKLNLTINKDIFVNTFAMNRFFEYYNDIGTFKSDISPIIGEWKE